MKFVQMGADIESAGTNVYRLGGRFGAGEKMRIFELLFCLETKR
jgi:hypothetical protein